ncbi:MAG: transposase [Pyrinomonadaceae bacterium]|nr:transposase [Pyrinomonadaceae bacterium]
MWNDTDIPLAHLITFRCYGTWLHGDERGSVDRFHNQYKSSYIPPNAEWQKANAGKLKGGAVILSAEQRISVEHTIREVCNFRAWLLRAVNVRTNHVHIVVSIGDAKSENALNSFKAYSTKKMREKSLWNRENSPWSDKGSKRNLWNERSINLAVEYVIDGQGGELPAFD